MHYTVKRLRAEIEPVAAATSCASCFPGSASRRIRAWRDRDAVDVIAAQLEGFEAPPRRGKPKSSCAHQSYEPYWLDDRCLAGQLTWARFAAAECPPGRRRGQGGARAHDPDHFGWRAKTPRFWASLSPRPTVSNPSAARTALPITFVSTAPRLRRARLRHRFYCAPKSRRRFPSLSRSASSVRQLRRPARTAHSLDDENRSATDSAAAARQKFGMAEAAAGRSRTARVNMRQTRMKQSKRSARHCSRATGVVFWRLLEREAPWLPPWRDLLRVYRPPRKPR